MKKIFVSFTTQDHNFPGGKAPHYKYSDARLKEKLIKAGKMDFNVIPWTKDLFITNDFFKENEEILKESRGAGYWLWKPFIIKNALDSCDENDIVVYMDAGSDRPFPSNIENYIKVCEDQGGFYFTGSTWLNKFFIKRDCYHFMDCDHEDYYNANQINAAFIIFKKNAATLNFVEEWLKYAKNKHIITDLPNICGKEDLPDFIDHRHDQAILSILHKKYNLPNPQIMDFQEI